MPKFRLPDNPYDRKEIWQDQLNRVRQAQAEIKLEQIQVRQLVIALELKMITTEGLEGERSKLHKAELESRMKWLCLQEQYKKLSEAIASVG